MEENIKELIVSLKKELEEIKKEIKKLRKNIANHTHDGHGYSVTDSKHSD